MRGYVSSSSNVRASGTYYYVLPLFSGYIYERYMREVHVKRNSDAHFVTILNLLNR